MAREVYAMKKYLFMRSVLHTLSEGKIFRLAFTIALRVLAGVAVLVGLIAWLTMWKLVLSLSGAGLLGGVLFQALFCVAVYAATHAILIRANDIANLPEGELTLLPIAMIIIRLIGEVAAAFGVVVALAGGILIWFAGGSAGYLLSSVPWMPNSSSLGGETFIGGVLVIAIGVLGNFFALTFFYWLAELLGLSVNIARNVERISRIEEARETDARAADPVRVL
jgi:hypothetical protein